MSEYRPDETERYGQPPYREEYSTTPYGQPPYQQPQYGQPPYQQPQHGQPPYQQPPQGQPPYQHPQYGQPPGYGRPANPFGPESNDTFGITGAVLGLLGGIAGVVALTAVEWFGGRFGGLMFGDVRTMGTAGFATAYYGWLAWAFLIIGVVCAVLSSFPNPALRVLRIIGVVIGFAAAGLSFLALQVNQSNPYTTYLGAARVGFYLAVIAYILIGIGAAYGPRREIRRV